MLLAGIDAPSKEEEEEENPSPIIFDGEIALQHTRRREHFDVALLHQQLCGRGGTRIERQRHRPVGPDAHEHARGRHPRALRGRQHGVEALARSAGCCGARQRDAANGTGRRVGVGSGPPIAEHEADGGEVKRGIKSESVRGTKGREETERETERQRGEERAGR